LLHIEHRYRRKKAVGEAITATDEQNLAKNYQVQVVVVDKVFSVPLTGSPGSGSFADVKIAVDQARAALTPA
jgi:hypothetical protein